MVDRERIVERVEDTLSMRGKTPGIDFFSDVCAVKRRLREPCGLPWALIAWEEALVRP